jgi:release factor glutamine methyltransferase
MKFSMPLKRVWPFFIRLRFFLFQRHRHNRLVIERVAGKPFVVLPEVFNPTLFFSSEFFAKTLGPELIPRGANVLDMGTGSGIGAVFAAEWAGCVIAVDINPAAVRCARINALLNEVDGQIEVREGDLFAPVRGEIFDVVLFNPPYLPGEAQPGLEQAFFSNDIASRFAQELALYLKPGGYALVILSDIGDEIRFLQAFEHARFECDLIAQKKRVNETLSVYKLHQIEVNSF